MNLGKWQLVRSSMGSLDWEIISFVLIEVFDSPPISDGEYESDKNSHGPYSLFINWCISQG